MKILKSITVLALVSGLSVPAFAAEPTFEKIADLPAGFDPTSNASRGGPGSRVASSEDGSKVFFSDFSLFNNYSWNNVFATVDGALKGPSLYVSNDAGKTFEVVTGAPQADWGPVAMSGDGQVLLAAHKYRYILNGAAVNSPGVWLSTDGGTTFAKQALNPTPGATWDVAMADDASAMIATEDGNSYVPFAKLSASAPWAQLPLAAGPWRSVGINADGNIIALCHQDSGIYVSRDRGASFAREIANQAGEGCGPMDISATGNTLAIGRFAHPDKKVFSYVDASWVLKSTIVGVSNWHSTGSVSMSADGSVIAIGDYRSSPALISVSTDSGASFKSYLYDATSFRLSGEAYVVPDGSRILSFNSDGLFALTLRESTLPGGAAVENSEPTAYSGPVIAAQSLPATAGSTIVLTGSSLGEVSGVSVASIDAEFEATANQISIAIPSQTPSGLHDLVVTSPAGVLRVQGAILVRAAASSEGFRVTKTSAGWKVYHFAPLALGKVQIFVNGKQQHWLQTREWGAKLEGGPKLRPSNSETPYLVRTLRGLTQTGSPVEIYVNGKKVLSQTVSG